MTARGFERGHDIYYNTSINQWVYADNNVPVAEEARRCVRCHEYNINGVDYCLRHLSDCDYIVSACCGHGKEKGYIVLADGRVFVEAKYRCNPSR